MAVDFDNVLKAGTTLKAGTYVIRRVLGQGGFGITYEAEQVLLGKRVAIKEFFLSGTCDRDDDGKKIFVLRSSRELFKSHKKRFLNEARRLAHLSNTHLVPVHDLFEENGTAYYVMDFVEGESLADILKRSGRPFDEKTVTSILKQMLEALGSIHHQVPSLCHLDIKPANIMVDSKGKAVLIDFGASKYVATADEERSSSSAFAYTPGYAPIEQLAGIRENMGPWTDFYALGATLYNLLTGKKPNAPSVINSDRTPGKRDSIPLPSSLSEQMRSLIVWLMAPDQNDRPQLVEEILAYLNQRTTEGEESPKGENVVEALKFSEYLEPSDDSEDIPDEDIELEVVSVKGEEEIPLESEKHKEPEGAVVSDDSERNEISGKSNGAYKPFGSGQSNAQDEPEALHESNEGTSSYKWLKPVGIAAALALVLFLGWWMMRDNDSNDFESNAEAKEKVAMSDEERNEILQNLVNNMVLVEGGTFMMGATSEQGDDADDDESPAHQVTVSSFSIGKYEVTQEEWGAVMGENPSEFKGGKNPVESVSWDDCQEFISKLNELTGKQFRLPTEAEWEFAARGGNKKLEQTKYAGGANIDAVAWYEDNSGYTTHPVGEKSPNALGLYDMSGNVWEWCEDYYESYDSSTQKDPKGPASGSNRVNRGGGWCYGARFCRVSYRSSNSPGYRYSYLGLRLAL